MKGSKGHRGLMGLQGLPGMPGLLGEKGRNYLSIVDEFFYSISISGVVNA